MASKFKLLKKKKAESGDHIGLLLPADWIELKGKFSPTELRTIATAIEDNFKAVKAKSKQKKEEAEDGSTD